MEKAHLLLATAYENQGKTDKAKAALYSLLAVNPNHVEAMRRIEELIEQSRGIQPVKFKTPVQIPQSATFPVDKAFKKHQDTDDNSFIAKNIGCLLFAVFFCVLFAIALFSMDKFWGGLVMVLTALFTIIEHFTNPDFWK